MTFTDEQRALAEHYVPLAEYAAWRMVQFCEYEDVLSDAFWGLTKAVRDGRPGATFATYARFCIQGEILEGRRRRYKMRNAVSDPVASMVPLKMAQNVADDALSPESAAISADIWNAVDELPRREATAIRLRFQHGYKGREIATLFDIGEARVSQLISKGCRQLRAVAA